MDNMKLIPYATVTNAPSGEQISEALKEALSELKASYEAEIPMEIPKLKKQYELAKIRRSEADIVLREKLSELEKAKAVSSNLSFETRCTSQVLKMFADAIEDDGDDDEYVEVSYDESLPSDIMAIYDAYNEAFKIAHDATIAEYSAKNELQEAEEKLKAFREDMQRIELGKDIVVRFRLMTFADKILADQESKASNAYLKYRKSCDSAERIRYEISVLNSKREASARTRRDWKKLYEKVKYCLANNKNCDFITEINGFIEGIKDLDSEVYYMLSEEFSSEIAKLRHPRESLEAYRSYLYGFLNDREAKLEDMLGDKKKKYDAVLSELIRAENSEWISSEVVIPVLKEQLSDIANKRRPVIVKLFRDISKVKDYITINDGIWKTEVRRVDEFNKTKVLPEIIGSINASILNRISAIEQKCSASVEELKSKVTEYDEKTPSLESEFNDEDELIKGLKEQASDAAQYAPKFAFGFGSRINPNVPSVALQVAHEIASKVFKKLGIEVCDASVSYNPEAAFKAFNGMPPKEEIILSMTRAAAKTTAKNSVKRQGSPTQWAIYFAAQSNRFSEVTDYQLVSSKYSEGITPYENDTENIVFGNGNQDLYDMVSAATEIPCLFGLSPKRLAIERKKTIVLLETAKTMKQLAMKDTVARETLIRSAEYSIASLDPKNGNILKRIDELEKLIPNIEGNSNAYVKRLAELRSMIYDIRLYDEPNKIKSKASAMMLVFDAIDAFRCARAEYMRACSEIMDCNCTSVISVIDTLYEAMKDAKANVAYMATRAMYRSINNYLGDNRGIRKDASIPTLSLDDISEVIADPRYIDDESVSEFTVRRRTYMREAISEAMPKLTPRQKSVLRVIYRTNGSVNESARILQIDPKTVREHLARISMIFSAAIIKVAPDSFERELLELAAIANELDVIGDKVGMKRVSAEKLLFDASAKAVNAEARDKKSKASHNAETKLNNAICDMDIANRVENAIKEVVNKMSPAMRDAMMLVAKGMPKREAARHLGKSESAVRLSIKEACKKVSKAIGDAVPELKESANAMAEAGNISELIKLAIAK